MSYMLGLLKKEVDNISVAYQSRIFSLVNVAYSFPKSPLSGRNRRLSVVRQGRKEDAHIRYSTSTRNMERRCAISQKQGQSR